MEAVEAVGRVAEVAGVVTIAGGAALVPVLAGIVLVRTLLGFSLAVEINVRWPWHRHDQSGTSQ